MVRGEAGLGAIFISTGRPRRPLINARQGLESENHPSSLSWAEDSWVSTKVLWQENIQYVPKWLEMFYGWTFTVCHSLSYHENTEIPEETSSTREALVLCFCSEATELRAKEGEQAGCPWG